MHVHVNIILVFPITYKNTSVLCQSECACLHQTVKMIVFFFNIIPWKYLHKRESTKSCANVQSCPSNKKREFNLTKRLTVYCNWSLNQYVTVDPKIAQHVLYIVLLLLYVYFSPSQYF